MYIIKLTEPQYKALQIDASFLWNTDEEEELQENVAMYGNGDDAFDAGFKQGVARTSQILLSYVEPTT
jgi:hypothetical protein